MGELKDKRIVQSKIWLDPNLDPVPPYDYDYTYPITVYDAVKQTMEDNSPTLSEELQGIYRLINSKQNIIEGGKASWVMTWTGLRGQIGEAEVLKRINSEPNLRSYTKLVSEKAIGDILDNKVDLDDFNEHANNASIHITDFERTKWNSMAPLSTLNAHMQNTNVHVSDKEKANWNQKADQKDLEDHIYDTNNPHNTTAHQVGTYTRREIDDMFADIRESFFNYVNIVYDERNNKAELVEYDPSNWNPNFVLKHDEELPDVDNSELYYFALRPATDYQTAESQECIIYVKKPGTTWNECGMQVMNVGDMVIKYPDTTMYVWVQGRWLKLFTGATDAEGVEGTNTKMWRPTVDNDTGILSWELSDSKDTPAPAVIKGKDGYTPIKGVDYDDGKDGQGVALGGLTGELLIKQSDENFDTTWKSLMAMLEDFVVAGTYLPDNLVIWDRIKNRPEWYDELGNHSDGFITQRAATRQFEITNQNITQILEKLQELDAIKSDLFDHINDYNNPHRVTPAIIGAVSMATFTDHVTNYENPHNVTAEQIGLGNVNNTSDMDKPISNATQEALDELWKKLNNISVDFDDLRCIEDVIWDGEKVALTFIYKDGSEVVVHIPITEIFNSIYYDNDTKELVIVLPDGTENRIDVSGLIQKYFGSTSHNINITVNDDNTITATVIPSSITGEEITYSVHLKGSPTTTTQPINDRSTRIATTEFVKQIVIDNLISYETDRPLSANMGRILNERKADIEDVIQIINDLEGLDVIDNLDSTNPLAALSANMGRHLDLIKAPRVHTSPEGSTFGRATISLFGHTRASEVDPLMDGTVFKGTDDGRYARADHRHPTDITRAPIHFPDVEHNQYKLTGEPKADTPPDPSNDERIATTEWVRRNAVGVSKGYCSTETTNPYKTVELRSTFCDPPFLLLQIGSAISVTFRFEDRSGETPTMLNVNGTGWHPVLFGGVPLTDGMLAAYHEHLFVFEGTYFRLINPRPGTGYGTIVLGPGKPAEINGMYIHQHKDIMSGNVIDDFTEENHNEGENGGTYTNNFFDGNEPEDLHEEYDPWNAGGGAVAGGGYITGSKGEDGSYTINQVSGITGYTCKGDGPDANAHGEVKCVYFTIPYESRRSNVAIEFPSPLTDSEVTDTEDNQPMSLFGAKMGDGTIIDLDDPKVKSTGDSSAIIQFTLAKVYALNSPCELIYKTNKAWIKITEVSDKSVNPVEEKKEESEESDD